MKKWGKEGVNMFDISRQQKGYRKTLLQVVLLLQKNMSQD